MNEASDRHACKCQQDRLPHALPKEGHQRVFFLLKKKSLSKVTNKIKKDHLVDSPLQVRESSRRFKEAGFGITIYGFSVKGVSVCVVVICNPV